MDLIRLANHGRQLQRVQMHQLMNDSRILVARQDGVIRRQHIIDDARADGGQWLDGEGPEVRADETDALLWPRTQWNIFLL